MISRCMIAMVRFYQKHISPGLSPRCKYYPSCSQYMIDAISEWGPLIGLFMGLWRILRCNPISHGGYDPVPVNGFRQARKAKKAEKAKQKNIKVKENPEDGETKA